MEGPRGLNIRLAASQDVESILAIQSDSPEIAQWTLWDYERVARGEMAGWVAEEASGVAGFLVARHTGGDIEILNFAVRREARRRGMGAALLQEALEWGRSLRAEKAFLEVRASNLEALQFYERRGFQAAGRRPRYYTAPMEDAMVLTLKLA